LEQSTYESVVKKAISLGNDTDTTAAIAGGIAGIRHGLSGIPTRWLKAMRGKSIVTPLVRHLLET
jgi:ADP-ribosylglycohydrolase